MLLVNAKAGPSKIHRLGLIAQEFIPAGTVIWKFREGFDVKLSPDEFEQLPEPIREQIRYYAFFCRVTSSYILGSDDDRFTNHSEHPNTSLLGDDVVAACDIRAGEEITSDYREIGGMSVPTNGVSL